jgi:glutamyl/glutaminyl-tRNA synthetase
MPIRASITGQLSGPELDQVVKVMGQERVVKRLKEAAAL